MCYAANFCNNNDNDTLFFNVNMVLFSSMISQKGFVNFFFLVLFISHQIVGLQQSII